MDNRKSSEDTRNRSGKSDPEQRESGHKSNEHFSSNRDLARSGDKRYEGSDNADMYDDYNSGKEENYKGGGYYGSNYSSISELNRGRNYESNSGYRYSYEHLPSGQWPEVERAAQSRGFDLRGYELSQRGVHRGKGPRAYQRSDRPITEDINDLLTDDPYIDASDIEINVEKGEVTLTGTVESRHIKRRVEDVVERVSGVKHVENRLRPKLSGGQTVNIRNAEGR